MDESQMGILPPFFSDSILFLSIVLSIILLIAISYIWSTQRQDRADISKLLTITKNLSNKVKDLEVICNEKSTNKEEERVVVPKNSIEPSIVEAKKELNVQNQNSNKPWKSFLEDYNHIAESMAVPGQLRACEKFISENKLKILVYIGSMNFGFASNVENSRFWAWQIEDSDKFIVVPNPMIPYDENLHNHAGMKETFASNYENGKYKKYFVELPATLNFNENNEWQLLEPGVIKLEH